MIAALAGRQFGVVARWQLLQASVTRHAIASRVASGRLIEIHRGVYLVGHSAQPRYAREMAALLACREGASLMVRNNRLSLSHNPVPIAALRHATAASLWELAPYPAPGDIRVTVPRGRTPKHDGIQVHHATLDPRDIRRRHGMPLTSPPRTILDMAHDLSAGGTRTSGSHPLAAHRLDDLELLVAEASYRKLATEAELRDQITRNPGKPGVRRLHAVLDLPGGPKRTRSPSERALLRLLRARGIEGFEVNAKVAGHEVDFLWRAERFAVEVDGWDGHSSRIAFERDRLKWATLKARGISVMPVTGRQIRRDPDGVIARLLAGLAPAPSA